VEPHPRPPFVEYELRVGRLHEVGRQLDAAGRAGAAEPEQLPGPDGRPRPAFDARVLRAFVSDGRLTSIPAQEKKRVVVLRYLAETVFEPDREYAEKEVNQRLAVLNEDVASLRRYLVDLHFMERFRGIYRLRPASEWPT